ncbi:MAG TPA: bifunctional diguanylate cyclase/phosphodiesterase [Xanthobacteraceae bacterium]|nr:bifunctional diguanylate cyclase/phosphodiesterase [Xanthobacteraceae bacterium]
MRVVRCPLVRTEIQVNGIVGHEHRPSATRRSPRGGVQPATAEGGSASLPGPDHAGILRSVGEVAYEWQLHSDALRWGDNAAEVLKIERDAISSGRSFAQFLAANNVSTRFDAVMQSGRTDAGSGVPYQVQYAVQPPDGVQLWVEDTGRWFAGADGRPSHAHGLVRIVTERHEEEQRLLFLSKFDKLTGEVNRWHLTELLAGTIEDAVRLRGSCGFLLIAIDNLNRFNEAYGFDIADEVIAAAAKRLRAKLRAGDVLGRFSGNKFGLLLRNCTLRELNTAAERLIAGVRDGVIMTSAGPIAATVTVGGVVAPRHARDAHDVLARAQETLHAARKKRPGSFLAYQPSPEREAIRRENVRATDDIVEALNQRRILLAFEPIVDTVTRRPMMYECLMRIARSDGTLASASTIIPIAERLGLVRLIDHRVLELAITELLATPHLKLSLNVSPASAIDADWWASLDTQLRRHSGVGDRLTVEITEMAEIRDVDETRGFVRRVKDHGCRIAIDDFGAGFTSFRNLRKLGIDIIKIDGAFVQNLTRSQDDRVFVRTLVELGRHLGLTTIAEWVQCEQAAGMLREWGCDYLQGALVGRASTERPWAAAEQRKRAGAG